MVEEVLRHPVLGDAQVALLRLGDPEDSTRIPLFPPLTEVEREVAVRPETDVREQIGPVDGTDTEGEMVVRDAEVPLLAVHPGLEQGHLEAQRGEQRREPAVELVTEAAAMAVHEFGDDRVLIDGDDLAQVDREVLERDRPLVREVQGAQCLCGRRRGAGRRDAAEIGVGA